MVEEKLNERLVYVVLDAITDATLATNQKQEFSELYMKVDSLKSYFFLNDLDIQERVLLVKAVGRYHKLCYGAISLEEIMGVNYEGMSSTYKLIRQKALSTYARKVGEVYSFFEEHYSELI